jgi:hypothetical protein
VKSCCLCLVFFLVLFIVAILYLYLHGVQRGLLSQMYSAEICAWADWRLPAGLAPPTGRDVYRYLSSFLPNNQPESTPFFRLSPFSGTVQRSHLHVSTFVPAVSEN